MYIIYIMYTYVILIFFMQYSSNVQLEAKHIQVSYQIRLGQIRLGYYMYVMYIMYTYLTLIFFIIFKYIQVYSSNIQVIYNFKQNIFKCHIRLDQVRLLYVYYIIQYIMYTYVTLIIFMQYSSNIQFQAKHIQALYQIRLGQIRLD